MQQHLPNYNSLTIHPLDRDPYLSTRIPWKVTRVLSRVWQTFLPDKEAAKEALKDAIEKPEIARPLQKPGKPTVSKHE